MAATDPPVLNDPGGFALGANVLGALSNIGVRQTAWRWRYDFHLKRFAGYGPHIKLAGEYLDQLPTEDGYYPGDHQGCKCSSVPILRGSNGRFHPVT